VKSGGTLDFAAVRAMGLQLPGVDVGTSYGAPALKLKGRMLACMATHKSSEPDSLVICIGFDQRELRLAADPDVFYLPPHYVNYPAVLVRLKRVRPEVLRELLVSAVKFVGERRRRKKPRRG
jgi:hypothetical protein